MIDCEDEGFGLYFHQFLERMLTPELHKRLCDERYQVLMDELWAEHDPNTYSMSIEWFKTPDMRNRDTFIRFILCYASVGVIPVSQPVLGECVEKFLAECGGWVTTKHKHKDAMLYRLPGCFEGGKRR